MDDIDSFINLNNIIVNNLYRQYSWTFNLYCNLYNVMDIFSIL